MELHSELDLFTQRADEEEKDTIKDTYTSTSKSSSSFPCHTTQISFSIESRHNTVIMTKDTQE